MGQMYKMPENQYRIILFSLLWLVAIIYIVCFDLRALWPDEGIRLLMMNGNHTWGDTLATSKIAKPAEVLNALGPNPQQPVFYLMGNAVFRVIGHPSVVTIRFGNILILFAALAGLLRLFGPWPNTSRGSTLSSYLRSMGTC